jgi:dephospho-CoA kinase
MTGGIGSGKSTVANLLAQLGAHLIDADAISRQCTSSNGAAIASLLASFGPTVLTPDGALDRNKMRSLIFADAHAKHQLECIVHPLVATEIAKQTSIAEFYGSSCIVYDIPLLVESKRWRTVLHRVLVVDCDQTTQISRVRERDGFKAEEVMKILAAQASRIERLRAADLVLHNDGITMDELTVQVQEIGAQFGL